MKNKFVRAYSGSDSNMLSTSGALLLLFNEDIAAFSAFDTTLDAAYATAWDAKINAAQEALPDSYIKDVQAGKTEIVLALMEQAKEKYNEVKFFAQKVFRDSPAAQNEFGIDSYDKARKSQDAMIILLGEIHYACQKYATELIAGGYDQLKIDGILALKHSLDDANNEQDGFKKGRPTLTQERIVALNECFMATRTVIDAAMVVFYNNPARRKAYVYEPYKGSSSNSNHSEVITKQVLNDGSTTLAFTIPYLGSRQFIVKNTGPADVEIFLANDANSKTGSYIVPPGVQEVLTSNMLGVEGDHVFLMVPSGDPNPETNVELEISLDE